MPGGNVMLSLRRARGLIRWLSLASPSARLPQEVLLEVSTVGPRALGRHATHHAQSNQSVQLNPAMKVSKQDGDWKEEYIPRFSHKQASQFGNFGDEHEDELGKDSIKLELRGTRFSCLKGEPYNKRIEGERQRCEGRNMQSICGPRLLTIHLSE